MKIKTISATLLAVAAGASAQAQSSCPCDAAASRTANTAALVSLLSNKMVCGSVGSEVWQEWHNGATASGGPLVDYKLGPGNAIDPSAPVGTYAIGADNTVSYTYGSATYKYAVCATSRSTYAFCGAAFGGRDIPDTLIGGSGLQSCSSVSATAKAAATKTLKK